MTAVFVFRHPETTWNRISRYQGRLEAPLSREGYTQARVLARSLAGQDLDAVLSSPLLRALTLARELAAATDAPLLIDHRLTELGQIPWEGLHRHEIERKHTELWTAWHTEPERVTFPEGECLDDVAARARGVMSDIVHRFPLGRVAVVTHSVVIQVMAALALGLPFRYLHRLQVANGSITTFCVQEPPGILLSLNATDLLYHSPIAAAAAQNCPPRRLAP